MPKSLDKSRLFAWASFLVPSYGGEGETRTPAPVTRPTPLAGAPRHQLEYFSICDVTFTYSKLLTHDLNGGEGGIRTHGPLRDHRFSRPAP